MISERFVRYFLCMSVAVWLQLFNYLFVYFESLSAFQLQAVVVTSLLFSWSFFRFNNLKFDGKVFYLLFVLCFFVFLSFLFTFDAAVFVRMLNLFYLIFLTYSLLRSRFFSFELMMRFFAITGFLGFYYLYWYSSNFDIRNDFVVSPNYIGLVVLSVSLASMFLKQWWLRYTILLSAIFIAASVSSRASMLCVALIFIFDFVYIAKLPKNFGENTTKKWLVIFLAAVILTALFYDFLNDALLINDEYRGLDTGLSGRTYRWDAALSEISLHPFVGVGYGASSDILGFTIDNAYLTALLELGWFGGFFYIIFVFYACYVSFSHKNYVDRRYFIFLLVFAVYGLFEKRYLSVGNSFSILFIFVVFLIFSKAGGNCNNADGRNAGW